VVAVTAWNIEGALDDVTVHRSTDRGRTCRSIAMIAVPNWQCFISGLRFTDEVTGVLELDCPEDGEGASGEEPGSWRFRTVDGGATWKRRPRTPSSQDRGSLKEASTTADGTRWRIDWPDSVVFRTLKDGSGDSATLPTYWELSDDGVYTACPEPP
jgi:hypothetical protein